MPKLRIELYPAQDDFVACCDRFTAMIGGIGSGKSYAGGVKALLWGSERKTLGMVTAPTYPMLRDATLRTFLDLAGDFVKDFYKAEMMATLVNGSEILFRSTDSPDRLRGPNLHWWFGDEASMYDKEVWPIMIGRLRADGRAGMACLATTPRGRNWLYERQNEMTMFRARTRDNPYLDREFIESLEASYTGSFARQELEGEFVSYEGLVYEDFDRGKHVTERHAEWKRLVIGVDEGYTNPAVLLVVGEDNDGRIHVIEEYYRRRVLQADVVAEAKRLNQQYSPDVFVIDPSAAGLKADMRHAGLRVRDADNAVFEGIQVVKGRLAVAGDGLPRLTVSPSCANLIAEFESYSWKETKQSGVKDEPEKVNDHACLTGDVLVDTERGQIPISCVRVGDRVLTRNGYRPVIASGMTAMSAPVLTVTFSDGNTLTGTANHPVYVKGEGYIELHALRYGAIIEASTDYQEMPLCQSERRPQWTKWLIGELFSAVIPKPSNGRTGRITRQTLCTGGKVLGDYIKRYGRILMGQSLMGIMSTILTAIHSIMTLAIWNVNQGPNIYLSMARLSRTNDATNCGNEWTTQELPLQNGTGRTPGGRGTKNSAGWHGKTVRRLQKSVNTASKNTKQLPCMAATVFAPINAEPLLDAKAGWITKCDNVNFANSHSRPAVTASNGIVPVHVVGVIDALRNEPVYNLTVDNAVGEYFANGVLVHNCDALRYSCQRLHTSIGTKSVKVPW